jgi:hypothetical protein
MFYRNGKFDELKEELSNHFLVARRRQSGTAGHGDQGAGSTLLTGRPEVR